MAFDKEKDLPDPNTAFQSGGVAARDAARKEIANEVKNIRQMDGIDRQIRRAIRKGDADKATRFSGLKSQLGGNPLESNNGSSRNVDDLRGQATANYEKKAEARFNLGDKSGQGGLNDPSGTWVDAGANRDKGNNPRNALDAPLSGGKEDQLFTAIEKEEASRDKPSDDSTPVSATEEKDDETIAREKRLSDFKIEMAGRKSETDALIKKSTDSAESFGKEREIINQKRSDIEDAKLTAQNVAEDKRLGDDRKELLKSKGIQNKEIVEQQSLRSSVLDADKRSSTYRATGGVIGEGSYGDIASEALRVDRTVGASIVNISKTAKKLLNKATGKDVDKDAAINNLIQRSLDNGNDLGDDKELMANKEFKQRYNNEKARRSLKGTLNESLMNAKPRNPN